MFRREAFVAVGGYDERMATEDIELTYRLLLAGWETTYDPRGLVGMRVPTSLRALWRQRRRWARGQGEVLHTHARALTRWRHHHLWPVFVEGLLSVAWIGLAALVIVISGVRIAVNDSSHVAFLLPAWGVAVAVITTIQFLVALGLERRYDRTAPLSLVCGPLYPAAYWLVSAFSALTSELPALILGPRGERVRWDTVREPACVEAGDEAPREALTPARPRGDA
jgi:biofilm PGA synthesis N-glycosyltransferase PgaC